MRVYENEVTLNAARDYIPSHIKGSVYNANEFEFNKIYLAVIKHIKLTHANVRMMLLTSASNLRR